jgi:hypothetical protein
VTRIVRTAYRYRRPPRRKQPVALEVLEVVKTADPAKARTSARAASKAPPPANDDRTPAADRRARRMRRRRMVMAKVEVCPW